MFWISFLIKDILCKYFLPSCRLPFDSVDCWLHCSKKREPFLITVRDISLCFFRRFPLSLVSVTSLIVKLFFVKHQGLTPLPIVRHPVFQAPFSGKTPFTVHILSIFLDNQLAAGVWFTPRLSVLLRRSVYLYLRLTVLFIAFQIYRVVYLLKQPYVLDSVQKM